MHLMLQQHQPDDYVVATGESHSVADFCNLAFAEVGLDYRDFVKADERFYRPAEVDVLVGNADKARTVLNWRPDHTFQDLVKEMVHADLEACNGVLKLANEK
jgi:GDPmannose 4,6-dehydratase